MSSPLAVIVLAAGLGTRTKVNLPKVLLPLCGRTLVETVLDAVAGLAPKKTVVVVHHQAEKVIQRLEAREGLSFVDQGEPKGTGHAVQVAMEALAGFEGDIVVLSGDVPLIEAETLELLVDTRRRTGAAVSMLTAFLEPPHAMGRILRDGEGRVLGVREEKDCTEDQLLIEEYNAGIYCFDAKELPGALAELSTDNAQGELYLTDTIGGLLAHGKKAEPVTLEDQSEVLGINTLAELALARDFMQERILMEHMANGVLIEDPNTTYIDHGVIIGPDTHVLPCTVIRAGVSIGAGCEVGPFSHLRVGTHLEDAAEVGNFVEVKKSFIGSHTKAKHLTYIGDATIGRGANIGAGTITANYDGKLKHATVIGDGVFVGSGTVLVAPSRMDDGSSTGAGAIVTRNTHIPAGDTFIGMPARSLTEKRKAAKGEGHVES